jgi:hypothetical protein
MLAETRRILDRCHDGTFADMRFRAWVQAAVATMRRRGSLDDARALLPAFLAEPELLVDMVPVLAEHGDVAIAERLAQACTVEGRLREDVPDVVLHALGYLGYEPAERLLWHYAEELHPPSSYFFGVPEACLGLLHLSCAGVRDEIGQALERNADRPLFPEFLPILAPKTGDPSWLRRLVHWGREIASTDCNGGLILGIALFGARDEFLRMLWDPRWEAYGDGTGSGHWAYVGARVLGIDMAHLDGEVRADPDRHRLRVIRSLLAGWVQRPWLGVRAAREPSESRDGLRRLLFEPSGPDLDDSLLGLARCILGSDDGIVADLRELRLSLHTATD